jgi:hypothetical protein
MGVKTTRKAEEREIYLIYIILIPLAQTSE